MLTIKEDTKRLALPSGRRVGQSGHKSAIQYLTKRMHEEKLVPFKGNEYALQYAEKFTNLAGIASGTNGSLKPLLIGAHYDSAIDAPSADDNAVAVALVLRIATYLKNHPLKRNIIIVFFDAEERPFFNTENMGSIRFYKEHCTNIEFATVIILDMIGHDVSTGNKLLDFLFPKTKKFLFIQGSESHRQLPEIIRNCIDSSKKLKIMTLLNKYTGDHSDHLAFRKAGIPYLFLCKGWGINSHTKNDTIDWVNFERVEKVYELVIKIINQIDVTKIEKNKKEYDPFLNDIFMKKKAIGFFFPLVLFLITQKFRLQSRDDIDLLSKRLKYFYSKVIK